MGRRGSAAKSGAKDLAAIALVKVLVSALVLGLGFQGVSDDDFARVAIAEAWAAAPRLDPTGTSWLPMPFWIQGAAMLVLGRGLVVARALAIALGIGAALGVYWAARWITNDRERALAGGLVAAAFPWSARLGVATIPELPAAALTVLGAASAVSAGSTARRIAGALAFFAATLCRYEPWPAALAFAALCVLDAARAWRAGEGTPRERARGAAGLGAAAAIALAGPLAWVLWNHHAHGDALRFVERVAQYRKAVAGAADESWLAGFAAYPLAIVQHEPELIATFVVAGAALSLGRRTWSLRVILAPYARPALLALAQVAGLLLALSRGGAPTHHPERATLVALLLLAIAAGDLALHAGRAVASRAGRAAALAAWAALVALSLGVVRRWFPGESFAQRGPEIAAGSIAAARVPAGETVLVEARDYGYFAFVAAMGRPEDARIDRSLDPRDARVESAFAAEHSLKRRIAEAGARWIAGRSSPVTHAVAGEPVACALPWCLWRAPAAQPASAGGPPDDSTPRAPAPPGG